MAALNPRRNDFRSTTILCVRRDGDVAMGGDGQVSLGDTVVKAEARKVRRLAVGNVLAGFAGSSADALTLLSRFEEVLKSVRGDLLRAAAELAREWRTDRVLRRLESLLAVAGEKHCFLISGTGDVIEPDDGILAIGSGGPYALAAARALVARTELGAEDIVRSALQVASEICVYTNANVHVETLAEGGGR